MPEKQSRESIEAELNATDVERAIANLSKAMRDFEEFERQLQQHERERGLASDRTKPLDERMAAVGMRQEAIDHMSIMFYAVTKILGGRADEIPDHVRRQLAEAADAEISAVDLLQDLLDARRGQP
jgi:hypothetical protein